MAFPSLQQNVLRRKCVCFQMIPGRIHNAVTLKLFSIYEEPVIRGAFEKVLISGLYLYKYRI